MKIKIDCCGFPLAKDKYFKHFDVVKLQQASYQAAKRIRNLRQELALIHCVDPFKDNSLYAM